MSSDAHTVPIVLAEWKLLATGGRETLVYFLFILSWSGEKEKAERLHGFPLWESSLPGIVGISDPVCLDCLQCHYTEEQAAASF